MARKSIAQTLEEQRVLIFNSSKPEIAPLLEAMSVDSTYLSTGEKLYNEVVSLDSNQDKESQESKLAYDNAHALQNDCEDMATRNFRLIKMAARADKDLQNRIKLNVSKETKIEEWINQTIGFYNLVLNESTFLSKISRYGLTQKKLKNDLKELESLKLLRNQAIGEKGQAQEATRLRNERMEELKDYCYELKTIASIALEGQPQLLEMLGILVRS